MTLNEQNKTGLLVTVFIGLVGLIVIGYFHFMIVRGRISQYDKSVQTFRAEQADLNKQLAQINGLVNQKAELQQQADAIRKVTRRLPSTPDAPGFLNALLTTLGTTGIIQEEVKPMPTTDRTLYTEIPYSVVAHGHYHSFGEFLTLIEQNPDRFMRVRNIHIENDTDRPSMHPVKMEITTFMFKQ